MANWYEEMLKKHPNWKADVEKAKEYDSGNKNLPLQAKVSEATGASVPATVTKEPALNALRMQAGLQAPEFAPASSQQPLGYNVPPQPLQPQPMAQPNRGLAGSPDSEQADDKDLNQSAPAASPEEAPSSTQQAEDKAAQNEELGQSEAEAPKEAQPEPQTPEQPQLQTLNFEGPAVGTNENLQRAQEAKRRIQHIANLGRSFDLLGAGIARAQPSAQEFYKDLAKQGEEPEQNLKALMQQEQSDPNSAVSKGFKEFVKGYGVDLQGNASAKDAAALLPNLYKRYHDAVTSKAKGDLSRELQGRKETQAETLQRERIEAENNRAEESNKTRLEAAKIAGENSAANRTSREDLRITGLTNAAARAINNDRVVQPMQQNYESLDKGYQLLTNKGIPVTPQILADAESDMTAALNIRGSTGVSEGKIKRAQIETINRKIAELQQTYLNQPDIDLRKEDPALVKQVLQTIEALKEDNRQAIDRRKTQLVDEFKATSGEDPRFQERLNNLQKQHKKEFQNREPGKEKSKGPEVGSEEDGYKFKGGDPSKQENWEKI